MRELVDRYHRARIFLLCSGTESFCLPLLEAQACGIPAVVRDHDALRETGGPGTSFVRGDHPADWSRTIQPLLDDDEAWWRARGLGLEHARRFDPDSLARRLSALAVT
jgi:glycosyltransferase involved in cell wall biosynthesis